MQFPSALARLAVRTVYCAECTAAHKTRTPSERNTSSWWRRRRASRTLPRKKQPRPCVASVVSECPHAQQLRSLGSPAAIAPGL
eukprot:2501668-Pyramimonas_sp.AAC.2